MLRNAGKNANRRRAKQTLTFYIPSPRSQKRVSRRQTRGMRRLTTGYSRETRMRGQPRNFFQPTADNFFYHRCRGSTRIRHRILIPRSLRFATRMPVRELELLGVSEDWRDADNSARLGTCPAKLTHGYVNPRFLGQPNARRSRVPSPLDFRRPFHQTALRCI
jgi:hypothetical protein